MPVFTINAPLEKDTKNTRVFKTEGTLINMNSIYINKQAFVADGCLPDNIKITIEWETPKKE